MTTTSATNQWPTQVEAVLRGLDQPGQDYLRLIYWHGRSHGAIATRAGLPVTVVSRIIANAMRDFAATFEATS